jgi:hypothetical protein
LRAMEATTNAVEVLDAYVDFWGNYIPEVYGLAKALLAVRETDKDAAAAWDDRMEAVREGCRSVINCLVRDQSLALVWNPDQAVDMLWAMISLSVWENLTIDCGWTQNEYISHMQVTLKKIFLK